MNARICLISAALTLMTLSSGCSGVRNFLFGRGARCGLCTNLTNLAPRFGNTMQAPCGNESYGPAGQTPQCTAPTCQGVVTAPSGCGCNDSYGSAVHSSIPCGTCGDCGIGGSVGNCGCGSVAEGYGPMVADPYMSGDVYGGQIIGEQVIGQGSVIGQGTIGGQPYATPNPPIQPDDFSARKFDSDGNRILWEEPLPEGTKSL